MQTPQPQAAKPVSHGAELANLSKDNSPRAKVLLAAMKIIYSNPKGFVDMIASADDPMQGIAMAAKVIFEKIAKDVKGVPPETVQKLYPVAVQKLSPAVVYLLVELAVSAGVKGLDGAGAPPAGSTPQPAGLVAQAQAQPQPQPAEA